MSNELVRYPGGNDAPRLRAPPRRLRLHPEPELRFDDARAEFRTAWQAKVDRKRQRARSAGDLAFVLKQLLVVIVGFGAIAGGFLGYLGRFGLSIILALALAGAFFSFALMLVAALTVHGYAQRWRGDAERLEREARELQRV